MKTLKLLGNIIFVISIIVFPLCGFLSIAIANADVFDSLDVIRYSYVMYLFVPIGILSLVFGGLLKKHGCKYKKNYVIGIIVIVLMALFGSYRFVFSGMINFKTEYIAEISSQTGVPFPDEVKSATEVYNDCKKSYAKLSGEEKLKFDENIKNDGKWADRISSTIQNGFPFMVEAELSSYDYYLFYNKTTNEFNRYPPNEGDYDVVLVAYKSELGKLLFVYDFVFSTY